MNKAASRFYYIFKKCLIILGAGKARRHAIQEEFMQDGYVYLGPDVIV